MLQSRKTNKRDVRYNHDNGSKTYTYNSGGNLVTAFDGTTTHTYAYYAGSWGDLLQYYDGQEIIYDKMGNPTSYYNGTRWNFTWQNGRELTTASKTGTSVSYTYDADGMRKTKTVNGVPHTYYYNGGTLLREVYGDTILDFFYNANGTPIAMRQSAVGSTNYTIYYYITNLQGDVIRLVDHEGRTAAYYRYDPYGKVIEASGSHANINPLRYRGYYYDVDTELYYLQSRYYDPQVCRFINADEFTATGQGLLGNNMFAYCGNNPVSRLDPYGQSWWGDFWREIKDWVEDEKEKASKNEDGTKTTGINLSGAFGAGGAVSGGITSDRKGNLGFVFTVAGGGGMPSWGLCAYSTTTNAPTIYNQGGLGTQVGGSFSAIISIGAEYTMLIDTEADQAYHGYTVMAGIGAAAIPAEAHGEVGYSWVLGFNVYDAALVVINWISPEE